MAKFNLAEAAKDILNASIASKKGGQDKPSKLTGDVAYGTKEAGKIGDSPNDTNDVLPDYTKGVPTATAPGAKAPTGSQPMAKLSHQPGQDKAGDVGAAGPGGVQGSESGYEAIRDRKAVGLAKQTMKSNPGATFQSYGEESEVEGDLVEEEKGEKEEKGHEDAAEDKKMIKAALRKEKMKEDMDALMSGENLSEEFVNKATTIFEAAVISRAEEVIAEAQEEMMEQFEMAIEEVKESLAEKLDDYINYMAEEWVAENKLAIESGLRAEIVEDFMTGLHNLFTEHYIDIPEDKVNVVEELTAKVEELEASLNEQINTSVQLTKELSEQKKIEAIYTACESLTQTQVEKMKSLAEGIEFTTEEEFKDKLETLKESYFTTTVKSTISSALNEEVHIEDEKAASASVDPTIAAYAKTISQTLVK
jgi:hypothetical protein